jgi:hypothetical protein
MLRFGEMGFQFDIPPITLLFASVNDAFQSEVLIGAARDIYGIWETAKEIYFYR